eukprot:scaffold178499_cov30-Tisochrysis_lutea.AAC.8
MAQLTCTQTLWPTGSRRPHSALGKRAHRTHTGSMDTASAPSGVVTAPSLSEVTARADVCGLASSAEREVGPDGLLGRATGTREAELGATSGVNATSGAATGESAVPLCATGGCVLSAARGISKAIASAFTCMETSASTPAADEASPSETDVPQATFGRSGGLAVRNRPSRASAVASLEVLTSPTSCALRPRMSSPSIG